MASHSHKITISSDGNHRHKINCKSMEAKETTIPGTGWKDAGSYYTEYDGIHTHTGTASAIGNNQKHENRQPFEVVAHWKRTN